MSIADNMEMTLQIQGNATDLIKVLDLLGRGSLQDKDLIAAALCFNKIGVEMECAYEILGTLEKNGFVFVGME